MYQAYWQLQHRPFEAACDGRTYYPSELHQGTLLRLRYTLENRLSAALVVGPSGIGKTLLVQQLAEQLPENCGPLLHLVFPQMPADQLLAYLAGELTGTAGPTVPTIEQSVRCLRDTLLENARAGRHAVVVLDEAHLLRDPETLEMLRLLLNFQHEGRSLLTLLLVGLSGLLSTLNRLPELDDRIDVKCVLPRFTLEQTMAYVSHRLHMAGATRTIFLPTALEALHDASQGVPRRINRLADLALLVGFAEELPVIGPAQIESVADELLVKTSET
ncbi:MAG: AAA family ATPase [Pirellulales bacterium]